jgi:hypothetical protein
VRFVIEVPRRYGAIPLGASIHVPLKATVHFSDGLRTQTIQSPEFRGTADLGNPHSPWCEIRPGGTLAMTLILEREPGDTLGTGQVLTPIEADRKLTVWIDIHGPSEPGIWCIPCTLPQAFPLRAGKGAAPADSLYITWAIGGISLPNPPS